MSSDDFDLEINDDAIISMLLENYEYNEESGATDIEWHNNTIFNHNNVEFCLKGGYTGIINTTTTILECFKKLFTSDCINLICEETNINAYQQSANEWVNLTESELLAFIGVTILMGINNLPDIHMYWSNDIRISKNILIQQTFTRDRYIEIQRYLHVYNREHFPFPLNKNETYPILYKIEPMIKIVQNVLLKHWIPYQNVTFDESMVPFRGRIKIKQFMKDKPTQWGFKLWKIACSVSSYVYSFEVYTGIMENRNISQIVYDQIKMLPQIENKIPWHVFCDNYFTNIQLALKLLNHGIYLTGTIQSRRIGYPDDLKIISTTLEYGKYQWRMSKPHIIILVWHDTKIVSFLSTYYNPLINNSTITRKKKNKNNLVTPFQSNTFKVPTIIADYNKYMKGVDIHDQHICYYPTQRKCLAWWKPLFWHMIEILISNARIIWNSNISAKKKLDILNFRLDLASQLIGYFSSRKILKENINKMSHRFIGKHYTDQSYKRRFCVVCKTKTCFTCDICGIHICPFPCMKTYHTK